MKKIVSIIILSFCFFSSKAQIIDSSITHILSVKIKPVYASIIDATPSTRLGVRIEKDNLLNQAEIYWELMDSKGIVTLRSREIVDGDDYENWPTDSEETNKYPFMQVINRHKEYLILDNSK